MDTNVTLIGFGEVAQTLVDAGQWGNQATCFDIKSQDPSARAALQAQYKKHDVRSFDTMAEALETAQTALCVVTADQAVRAAQEAAQHISAGAFFCDMNSVSPQSKRQAAEAIDHVGGRYVDVAIMSPIQPAALSAPLLVSGPHARQAAGTLETLGFHSVRICGARVGDAAATKMIRSVMIKGIEALTAECTLAAHKAGLLDEVARSLGPEWLDAANYRLERMLVHGARRAAEMEEVTATLNALGTGSSMSGATAGKQRQLGGLNITQPEADLAGKLKQITGQGAL